MENERYLITTDNWFYAPNGHKYRSAWGKVEILNDSFLGIDTNRNSSNWFARIGGNGKEIIVAGCNIHYAVRSDNRPYTGEVNDTIYSSDSFQRITRDCETYIAE